MEACVTKPLCTKTVYMNTSPVEELIRKYQQLHSNSVNLSVKTAHMVQLTKYDILLIVGVVVIRNRIDDKVKVEAAPTI
jgi:hypothetical protein